MLSFLLTEFVGWGFLDCLPTIFQANAVPVL
jgi:hypothetical protein